MSSTSILHPESLWSPSLWVWTSYVYTLHAINEVNVCGVTENCTYLEKVFWAWRGHKSPQHTIINSQCRFKDCQDVPYFAYGNFISVVFKIPNGWLESWSNFFDSKVNVITGFSCMYIHVNTMWNTFELPTKGDSTS